MCRFMWRSQVMLFAVSVAFTCSLAQNCSAQQPLTEKTQTEGVPNSVLTPKNVVANRVSVSDLTIGVSDLLEVSVFGSPEFDHPVRVGSAGDILLPLVGSVHVAGLSPEKAQKLIRDKLIEGDFYKNPQVSVFVKEYASGGAYVLGEVQRPGFYPLLNAHRLFEVLSIAGGLTPTAGRIVTITNPNDARRTISVKLSNDPEQAAEENVKIIAGDTIMVSKAGIVYVVGDVRLPTGVVMEHGGLTVLQAIAMAQGTNPTAALDRTTLIRRTVEGPQETPIPLKKILAAQAPDLKLQPDDIIFVPRSAAKSAAMKGIEAALQAATGIAIYGRY